MDELNQIPTPAASDAAEEVLSAAPAAAAGPEAAGLPEDAPAAPEAQEEQLSEPETTSEAAPAEDTAPAEDAASVEDAAEDGAAGEPAPAADTRVTVADIQFRAGGKTYFFDPDSLTLKAGDHVIIDTARGSEYGICALGNHTVRSAEVVTPLRKVLRIATPQDEKIAAANREKEKRAFQICQQKIEEHKLEMQLVSAECAFDGSKLLFFFTADGRVDFRELVKNLASVFRTRIELRQIGVRDKAKMVGGLGVCGRPFCCSQFLDDFQPVSIKMAKTQNLSLNPTKISGTCGRLMCCLKYEQEAYEELLKTAPRPESFVDTVDGRGTVCDVNLLRQTVRVRMEDSPETIGCYHNCDICVLRSGKAKKTDPPIPRDLAPISSQPHPVRRPEAEKVKEDLMPIVFKNMDEYAASPSPVPAAPEEPDDAPAAGGQSQHRRRRRRGGQGPQSAGGQNAGGENRPAAPQQNAQERAPSEKPKQDSRPPRPEGEAAGTPQGEDKAKSSRRRPRRRRPKAPGAQNPPEAGA